MFLDLDDYTRYASYKSADALAAYLNAIRPGQIVVLATKGNASAHLNEAATDAMRNLGSSVSSPDQVAGQSHALVGIQGAAPGTAAEAIVPNDAFLRIWGDFRELSAAVDWIEAGP
jgi:hypothetical protein